MDAVAEAEEARIVALLEHDDEYNILMCREHGYAVRSLDTHLRDEHAVAAGMRRRVAERYASVLLARPADVGVPPPFEAPFDALRPPVDALLCAEPGCEFASVQPTSMRSHCNKTHGWRAAAKGSTHWTGVKAQTFFTSGGLQRYFAVLVPGEAAPRRREEGLDALLDEWAAAKLRREEELQVMETTTAPADRTGWFNRTGWPEHLAGSNYRHLAHAARLPDRSDDARLRKAAAAVEAMVERCVAGLSTLGHETRRWLKSADRDEISKQPMARLQEAHSQARYARYWKRFVCYCLRVLEEETRHGDGGDSTMNDARRLFVWRGRQKELAAALLQSLDGDDEDDHVEKTLQLSASFVFDAVGDRPFRSGLVHFLAVMGIDAEMGRLRTATDYSTVLAGVLYCVRVIGAEALLPAARRDEQGDAERNEFLRRRKDFLADGSYSATSTVLSWLAYTTMIGKTTGSSGNTSWSADGRTLHLHGRPIVLDRFRAMVHDVVVKAESTLWSELMQADRFELALDKVVDDVSFTKRGVSFVNRENGLDDKLAWMLARAQGDRTLYRDGRWRTRDVRRYVRRVDAFLELLLFAMHTTGGQPARGTELVVLRHRNGFKQDRNVFVIGGRAVFVTRYHKSQAQWDRPKVVPRFLPRRVGQLLTIYLAYVQPFREYLAVQALGGGWTDGDHLWANARGPGPWESDRLSRVLSRETQARLGTRLDTRSYRHAAVSIGRRVVGEAFGRGFRSEVGEVDGGDSDDESPLELQAGRTTAVGAVHYGVPIDIVRHLSERSLEMFRLLSEKWHRFLGFDGEKEEREKEEREKEERKETLLLKTAKRRLSRAQETRQGPKRARAMSGCSEHEVRTAMQQVLGRTEVSFRSAEQERALHSVLGGWTPLVVVLPTGGGKSMLFMVPASMADAGATIVVVPFRALVNDMLQRLRQARIDHLEWRPGETNAAAAVVVSADMVSGTGFLAYACGLAERGHLRRVVVDECHLTLTSSMWRPKLAQLRDLRVLGCQTVLLTATLPPVLERELSESMLVRSATYIRASTVRPNIRYTVITCRAGQLAKTALETCRRQRLQRKGVVYCRSKAQCEQIAEELGCSYYHAGMLDRAERLEAWIESSGFIVATSALGTGVDISGIEFVLHVDVPWGMIDYAQESGRAGRSGSGLADSVVLVEEHKARREKGPGQGPRGTGTVGRVDEAGAEAAGPGSVEEVDAEAMMAFVRTRECRRAVMSRYLDGRETRCGDVEGAAACDRCGEGRAEWEEQQRRDGREWALVQATLDELADGCAVCWVLADAADAADAADEADEADDEAEESETYMHARASCRRYEGLTDAALDEFRRGIRYDGGESYACMKCGVEQRVCGRGEDSGARCRWPNVLVAVVRAAADEPEYARLVRQLGYTGGMRGQQGLAEYGAWLGKRHGRRLWGKVVSNGMAVMARVIVYLAGE